MNVLTQEHTLKKTAFLSFKIVLISSFMKATWKEKGSDGSQFLSNFLILGHRSQLSTAG